MFANCDEFRRPLEKIVSIRRAFSTFGAWPGCRYPASAGVKEYISKAIQTLVAKIGPYSLSTIPLERKEADYGISIGQQRFAAFGYRSLNLKLPATNVY